MATSINSYSVGLTLDASSYIRNSELSRKETAQLRRDIEAARTPAENYERHLNRLDKALQQGAIDQATYNRLLADAKSKFAAASGAADNTANSLSAMRTRLLGVAAAYVGVHSVVRTGSWAIKLAADAEQAQVAFEVLLKDGDKAKSLLTDLRAFSAATPFRQDEIINSGRKLLAFGFTASEVSQRLHMMGNISAATGNRIEELADLLGRMRVQNKIMSEDLNQLTGRGINVLDGLAKRLGTDDVKDAASKGKIAFEDLLAVLNQLAESDYGGMLERQAETLAGRWSTFNDKLDETGRLLGGIAAEQDGILDTVGSWIDNANLALSFAKQTDQQRREAQYAANQAERESLALLEERRKVSAEEREAERAARREKAEADRLVAERAAEMEKHTAARVDNFTAVSELRFEKDQVEQLAEAYKILEDGQRKVMETQAVNGSSFELMRASVDVMLAGYDQAERAEYDRLDLQRRYQDELEHEKDLRRDIASAERDVEREKQRMLDERIKKEERIRADIAKGIGSGSLDEGQKFFAEQVNRDIANRVKLDTSSPDKPTKEQEELQKLRAELKQSNKEQADLLRKISENGFKRIR